MTSISASRGFHPLSNRKSNRSSITLYTIENIRCSSSSIELLCWRLKCVNENILICCPVAPFCPMV